MGKVKVPEPVKLFVAMLAQDTEIFCHAEAQLEKVFGEIDFRSAVFPFTHTDYYDEEMGKNLWRKFVVFLPLVDAAYLTDAKKKTNAMEERFSFQGKRQVNLDAGYVALSKVVLASTKDYYHRIYLGEGIFAEVTLHFKDRSFQSFPWTYPDYQTQEYINVFNEIRAGFFTQIRGAK